MRSRPRSLAGIVALLICCLSPRPLAQAPAGRDIRSWTSANLSAIMSFGGTYTPVEPSTYRSNAVFIPFWNVVRSGASQLESVVLAGWQYNGTFDTTLDATTRTKAAIFEQQADGTLLEATQKLFGDSSTDGSGNVLVADFNRDGRDDVFLPAHNESPQLWRSSVAFLSRPDGLFTRVDLQDQAANHGSGVFMVNGIPKVIGSSLFDKSAVSRGPSFQAVYSWNGSDFTVQKVGTVGSLSAVAGNFTGDGQTWIALGDLYGGPGLAGTEPKVVQGLGLFKLGDTITTPSTRLPKPYFNDKPEYAQYVSFWDPAAKTHNPRIYSTDLNQDGLPDVIPFSTIWSNGSANHQQAALQLLINHGAMQFTDDTDSLAPEFSHDSVIDYSLMLKDADGSGIDTFFIASPLRFYPQSADAARQSNYILVNDGTGRLYAAMHDEFPSLTEQIRTFVKTKVPGATAATQTPQFIPYRTAAGAINFGVVVELTVPAYNGVRSWAIVSLATQINLATDFRRDLTVATRNGSHRIRTFAGNDVIYRAASDPDAAIDGGLGANVAVYPGPKASWSITRSGQSVVIKPVGGAGGTDTLTRIQTARFADGDVDLTQ
jgi:hypothetical protein